MYSWWDYRAGDFHRHLDRLPREGRRLVAFLGGTIGNLRPHERLRFLRDLERTKQRYLAEELDIYFDDISDAAERTWDILENYKEVIEAGDELLLVGPDRDMATFTEREGTFEVPATAD